MNHSQYLCNWRKWKYVDPTDPSSFEVDPATGDTLPSGTVLEYNGYLFDPVGSDGVPFSGDEPLAATGYFFTYQFLEAGGIFPAVLECSFGCRCWIGSCFNRCS